MSDSTKLMASPDEVEDSAAAPAAGGEATAAAKDEPTATAAADSPLPPDEPTGELPGEPAAEQVVVGAGVEPAPEVRGAFGTHEYTSVGDDPARPETEQAEAVAEPVAETPVIEAAATGEEPAEPAAGGQGAAAESVAADAAAADAAAADAADAVAAEPAAAEPAAEAAAAAGEENGAVAEPPAADEGASTAAAATAEPTGLDASGEPAVGAEAGATEADAPVPPAAQVAGAPAAEDAADGDGEEPAASGLAALKRARDERRSVEGRVFGWNPGGFHVVIDGIAAFCPRSEMELEPIADPESYLDKSFQFAILKIQGKGRRIVLSRVPLLREEHDKTTASTLQRLRAGAVVTGKVASLTDFGAFVDVGGVEGLVHVSEISQRRVGKPSDVLQVGQEVEVKVLKVERGGRRVSLSMKALEPDPWREVKERYPEGAIVTGKVERTEKPGAFIELEPGLVGLLPTSEMGLPREAIPARAYPAGKQVKVQVVSVDPRRHRIGLAPEGSRVEGTRGDYAAYVKQQQHEEEAGFKPFAAALGKLKPKE